MPINFRDHSFNESVNTSITRINTAIYNSQETIEIELIELHLQLITYYTKEGSNYPEKESVDRANGVFSQFLQNLVYVIYHNNKNILYSIHLVSRLLDHPFFFYQYQCNLQDKDFHTSIWVDPQEKENALAPICRAGDLANTRKILILAAEKLGGRTAPKYQEFLTQKTKDGMSLLNKACMNDHLIILTILLTEATEAYRGKNTPGFQQFLMNRDNTGYTSLNTAVRRGDLAIVNTLLAAATEAFGGKNTSGFSLFLTIKNKDGSSPLLTACKNGHLEILKVIIAAAEEAYNGKSNPLFQTFLTNQCFAGYSPLLAACTGGHLDIVNLLIAVAEEAYKNKSTSGFSRFLTNKNKYGFSPLLAACKKEHVRVVRVLLGAAAQAYGSEVSTGFQTFLKGKNKCGYSPFNTACTAGNLELVVLLMQVGRRTFGDDKEYISYLNQPNNRRFSPLDNCYEGDSIKSEAHQKIAQLLVKAGASRHTRKLAGLSTHPSRTLSQESTATSSPAVGSVRPESTPKIELNLSLFRPQREGNEEKWNDPDSRFYRGNSSRKREEEPVLSLTITKRAKSDHVSASISIDI